jgi:hypothetical protein
MVCLEQAYRFGSRPPAHRDPDGAILVNCFSVTGSIKGQVAWGE